MNFPETKAFATNWVNGMKLSSGHFQHLENSLEDAVRDARALAITAANGFGLLPFTPFQLRNAEGATSQSARIILEACRAILPGGYRVEILPENIERLQLPATQPHVDFVPRSGVHYSVFLTVSETERKEAGKPEIQPIRHPYLVPDYRLEVVDSGKVPVTPRFAPNRMKIGEWKDGKCIEGYIPPTLAVEGYSQLEKWHDFLKNKLENISRVCGQVIVTHRRNEPERAAFCTPILTLLKSTQGQLRYVVPRQSPTHLVAYYEDLAGLVESLLSSCDQDFVRNHLQDGKVNGLLPALLKFTGRQVPPHEEIALRLVLASGFVIALLSTLQGLIVKVAGPLRSGDRNISSG